MSSTDTTTNANAASNSNTFIIPQPPTITGDAQADNQAIIEWMWDLYSVLAVQNSPLNPNTQQTAAPWDPNNPPQPSNTTLATAQQWANMAYKFASLINNTLANPVTPPTPS